MAGVLFAATARAESARFVHVLHVAADREQTYAALTLTKALEQQILRRGKPGFANTNKDLLSMLKEAKCGRTLLEVLREAPGALGPSSDASVDEACQKRVAAAVGAPINAAEAYLWGHLYVEHGRRWAKVHLWQKGQPERVKAVPYEDGEHNAAAERLWRHLWEPERIGDVRVTTGSGLEGELYVDGVPKGRLDARGTEMTVDAGERAFELRAGARVVASARVVVSARDAVANVLLVPVAEPAASASPPRPAAAPPASPRPLPPRGANWQRPVGWAAVGVGAAALVFGVVANARAARLQDAFGADAPTTAYREGIEPGSRACEAAERRVVSARADAATPADVRDDCSAIGSWKTMRTVGYAAGGALVVGGVALVLLSPSPSLDGRVQVGRGRAWSFAPSFGPAYGGASFAVSW